MQFIQKNPKIFNVVKIYMCSSALVGFYRGFNNQYTDGMLQHYTIDYKTVENKSIYENKEDSKEDVVAVENKILFVDKFSFGIISMVYYVNPFFHPLILLYGARRMEKRIRRIPFLKQDWIN